MGVSTFFIKEINGEQQLQSLEHSLTSLAGVERALIDTNDNEIKIEYNETKIDLRQIAQNIENNGFQIK